MGGNNGWLNRIHTVAHANSLPIYTYYRGDTPISWIDHILTYGESGRTCLQGVQTMDGSFFNTLSDHRPIMASFLISGGPKTSKSKQFKMPKWQRKPLTVDLKNDEEVAKIHAHLSQFLLDHPPNQERTPPEAGEYLLSLNKAAVGAIIKVKQGGKPMRKANWKGYKDGWSPTMIALKSQLHALQTMLRHLTGRNKHRKWQTTLEAAITIKELTDQWEAEVFTLKWPDKTDAYKIMDTAGRGPSYWRTLGGYPKLKELVEEIKRIKKKLHGRQRTELRILINSAVAARELGREKASYLCISDLCWVNKEHRSVSTVFN